MGEREKQKGSCVVKRGHTEEQDDVGGLPATQGREDYCQGSRLGPWSYHSQNLCSQP